MNELINITKATINNEEVNAVNARELHEKLEVKTQFKDWMPRRIEEFGFEEGKDFSSILSKSHGRPVVKIGHGTKRRLTIRHRVKEPLPEA